VPSIWSASSRWDFSWSKVSGWSYSPAMYLNRSVRAFHLGPLSGVASATWARNSSSVHSVRATPMTVNPSSSTPRSARRARAGRILRAVRSPEAPKMTMATGGALDSTGGRERFLSALRPAADVVGCTLIWV
jgi:hypothetical protein